MKNSFYELSDNQTETTFKKTSFLHSYEMPNVNKLYENHVQVSNACCQQRLATSYNVPTHLTFQHNQSRSNDFAYTDKNISAINNTNDLNINITNDTVHYNNNVNILSRSNDGLCKNANSNDAVVRVGNINICNNQMQNINNIKSSNNNEINYNNNTYSKNCNGNIMHDFTPPFNSYIPQNEQHVTKSASHLHFSNFQNNYFIPNHNSNSFDATFFKESAYPSIGMFFG
ncbi:hypothetical protein HELRODRAFT_176181 [Helobdella robusta]|uniref:Uncharacterized protein n=1 Tax=Helobdella robusta TaxID=6412 RepID=T1FA95_HELRO|nr:hypothetical protein HELRODRAFT_176181 [Helobdella robusta]ESO00312.1 hypothetical protein HELRODRAFT_176181 [Helobdella robusta]